MGFLVSCYDFENDVLVVEKLDGLVLEAIVEKEEHVPHHYQGVDLPLAVDVHPVDKAYSQVHERVARVGVHYRQQLAPFAFVELSFLLKSKSNVYLNLAPLSPLGNFLPLPELLNLRVHFPDFDALLASYTIGLVPPGIKPVPLLA